MTTLDTAVFPSTAREQQDVFAGMFETIHELVSTRELPEVSTWTFHLPYSDKPYAEGQLAVTYSDTEARAAIAGMLAILDAGRITENRSRNDTFTTLDAKGPYRGVQVRIWTHVDHVDSDGGDV